MAARRDEPQRLSSRRERRAAARAERAPLPRSRSRRPERRPVWRSPMAVITGLALALGAGFIVVTVLSGPRTPSTGDASFGAPPSYRPATVEDVPSLGSPSAPVVLEVWSDYQCPVCGRFAREYLPRLVGEFVAAGELRIVEQSIDILGTGDPSESLLAAVATDCAGQQGRYWSYHDWLFWNQAGENEGAFSRDRLLAIGAKVGLDIATFESCLDSAAARGALRSRTNAAIAAGIHSTPTFVVNGQLIAGLVAYDDLAGVIRQLAGASPSTGAPAPSGS